MQDDEATPTSSGTFVAWPEIKKFSTMLLHLEEGAKFSDAESVDVMEKEGVGYRGKIKLHGTNSGVTVMGDEAVPQSRTRSLIGADNEGFGKWVRSQKDYFAKHLVELRQHLGASKLVLFGEWCGSGIMRGAAICRVPERHFCIFGLNIDDHLIIEPEMIEDYIVRFKPFEGREGGAASASASVPSNLVVLPWLTEEYVLKFQHASSLNEEIAKMNKLVGDIDSEDPWVKQRFDISGPGEGVVWYPSSLALDGRITMSLYGKLVFKAKGEKHLVVKQKQPIQRHVEVPEGVDAFIDMFVTTGRLEQGVTQVCEGKFDKRFIGKFVNWMAADVEKESKVELEHAKLNFGQVKSKIMERSRAWYLANIPNISLDK